MQNDILPQAGLETLPRILGKQRVVSRGGAESGALTLIYKFDPDVQRIADVWPSLPLALKAGILAMIESARK